MRCDAGRTELEAREQKKNKQQPQYHFAKIVLCVRIGAAFHFVYLYGRASCTYELQCAIDAKRVLAPLKNFSHCLDKTKTSEEIKYNWYKP